MNVCDQATSSLDVYISADIEADGPIPGKFSMLALGLAVAATFDGVTFAAQDPAVATFYRELKPIGIESDSGALEVSGLNRESLELNGIDPATAMHDAAYWVSTHVGSARAVLVGYPVVFDWMFIQWYFMNFLGKSPFGFGSALDMKTMYQQKAHVTVDLAGRTSLPPGLASSRPHTHNALNDAIEQAEIFNRLFMWGGAAQ